MPRRVLSPDARRTELITAARAVFAEHGYHHAKVAQIIGRVGCSRGTFYNYFDNKRDVFGVVADQVVEELVDLIVPIDVSLDIPEQIHANVSRIIRAAMTEAVMRTVLAEGVGIDAEADEALVQAYDALLEPIENALRVGAHLGVVHVGDPETTARMLLGTLKEPLVQARLRGEDIDEDALFTDLMHLLASGVLGSQSQTR